MKIFGARGIYRLVRLFYREERLLITRNSTMYEVDISEGIDLSLFLLGNFQTHVARNALIDISEDGVVFDVGANVGIMTMEYAKLVPHGHVYAFEPTHYAYVKLQKNLSLNSTLSARVTTEQTLLSNEVTDQPAITAYSSWKVDGSKEGTEHGTHGGAAKSTDGVGCTTIDAYTEARAVERLDLMKIDTDGYELPILMGAKGAITKFRPTIVFEVGLYLLAEHGQKFTDLTAFFSELGYKLYEYKHGKEVTAENYQKYVPQNATTDLIAKPC